MNAEKCKGNKHIGKYISQLYRKGSVFINKEVEDLEVFHPKRMASRILGMGDVLTLIEKAENDLDEKNARIMMEKIKKK